MILVFQGPGSEKKWYETHAHELDGEWEKTDEGRCSTFPEVMKTVELILRTVISVDQLSVYEAVADLCEEASGAGNPPRVRIWNQW